MTSALHRHAPTRNFAGSPREIACLIVVSLGKWLISRGEKKKEKGGCYSALLIISIFPHILDDILLSIP